MATPESQHHENLMNAGTALQNLVGDNEFLRGDVNGTGLLAYPDTETHRTYGTATLEPDVLGGFGTMVGLQQEMELLFPDGTDFKLIALDGGQGTYLKIGADRNLVEIIAWANGSPDSGRDNILAYADRCSKAPGIRDAAYKIVDNTEALVAAAQLVVRIVEHLQQTS